jgi:hypothetical protein
MTAIELGTIKLASGSHTKAQAEKGQACLLEWTAIFAGEDYGDHPTCTSAVLGAFGRALNDGLNDEDRQRLVPFIPRLVGTAGDPAADEVRAWMATDWLVRVFTPPWLRKAGLTARAESLEALPELTSTELATAALPIIEAARTEANAAAAAARDAARYAARAAAWDAAGAAAGAAAWDAARAAAWDAAWAAAWAAARDAAWDAAGAAYDNTKGSSAVKYDAAYKAARDVLDPIMRETVAELLDSSLTLFGRMCDYRTAATT